MVNSRLTVSSLPTVNRNLLAFMDADKKSAVNLTEEPIVLLLLPKIRSLSSGSLCYRHVSVNLSLFYLKFIEILEYPCYYLLSYWRKEFHHYFLQYSFKPLFLVFFLRDFHYELLNTLSSGSGMTA